MSKTVTRSDIRTRMQHIDPYEFEKFVAELWEEEGWTTTVSQASNDQGVDVVAEKNDTISQRLAIQVKRYSDGNKVGRPEVQQYYSLKEQDTRADAAVVVTTSEFTKDARLWAYDHNVKLINGEELTDMVEKHRRFDLLDEYAPTMEEIETSSTSSTSKSSSSNKSTGSGEGPWFKVVLGTVGTWALFLFVEFNPSTVPILVNNVSFWLAILGMFVAPIAIWKDLGQNTDAGLITKLFWLPIGFFPIFGPAVYVWRRLK